MVAANLATSDLHAQGCTELMDNAFPFAATPSAMTPFDLCTNEFVSHAWMVSGPRANSDESSTCLLSVGLPLREH
eukprot:10155708-Heterocapsa_arctica.AAC.1